MANHYVEFSEVVPNLTPQEEEWLSSQLECVWVFGDREYTENEIPKDLSGTDADWVGCRAFRDMEDFDGYDDYPGFSKDFCDEESQIDGWGRYLWIYSEECGSANSAVHLVQKFLKRFRPNGCWYLTYAYTCSKPRVGEFGGGGVFVTADTIERQDAYAFVQERQQTFLKWSGAVPADAGLI